MTTKLSRPGKRLQRLRLSEIVFYAGTAALAIGQMFYAASPIGFTNAVLALTGIPLALLAILSITPVTALLTRMKTTPSGCVLDFHHTAPETSTPVHDDNRRAA